ncbi:PLP-dependent aminotransferase family protein [uncultured Flavobacterium sp.]|uniref:aminotransferase-like domain-containing protein n=1 Tax=uncultured Flavobacterium sp. TaxID=165435 RepID=UPI0025EA9DE0|nr:PLP-dependent aminotransferase family protein [uncultured Flavobacterium sp.]
MIEKTLSTHTYDVVNPLLTNLGEDVMGFLNEVQLQYPKAISFASGRPDANYFNIEKFSEYLNFFIKTAALEKGITEKEVLNDLGQYNRTKGIINKEIAKYLLTDESIQADPEDIIITVGAQEGIAMGIMTVCDKDKDVILVEDPAYIGITHFSKINGYDVDGIPVTSEGISLEKVEEKIQYYRSIDKNVKVVYVIPNFQNPTGIAMSLANRYRLLELAETYDFLIFEDNAYGDFSYEDKEYPSLKSLDQNNRVIYLRSLSKTLYPSLRLSLMVVTQSISVRGKIMRLSDLMAKTKGYITVNTPSIIQAMFGGLLRQHKYSLKELNQGKILGMKTKRDYLLKCLEQTFDAEKYSWAKHIKWNKPEGGFFITIMLPFQVTKQDVRDCAEKFKVIFTPMSFFYLEKGGENELRLAFSNLSLEEMKTGIERLANFIETKISNQ